MRSRRLALKPRWKGVAVSRPKLRANSVRRGPEHFIHKLSLADLNASLALPVSSDSKADIRSRTHLRKSHALMLGGRQMSTQVLLTVGQVTTIRQDGGAEFVPHNASIRPDRFTFANFDELTAHLHLPLGGQTGGRRIRGSISRKCMYSRHAADGTESVTFGDPLLDAISSAAGTLIIGDQTIDLREGTKPLTGAGGGAIVFDAPLLKFTGIV